MEFVTEQWQAALAGAGIYGILREIVGIGLRIKAAQLRANKDPRDDGVADVLDDTAKRLEVKR